MMPYLLLPCQHTWSTLPEVLRPTTYQLTHLHDIAATFLPIPALRNVLSRHYVDWSIHASRHSLTLDWRGIWGDVGEVPFPLTVAGNWNHSYQPLRPYQDIDFYLHIDPENDSQYVTPAEMKAIFVEPSSGHRFVSAEFERQCWILENWHFEEEVTSAWPELKAYPQYLKPDPLYSS